MKKFFVPFVFLLGMLVSSCAPTCADRAAGTRVFSDAPTAEQKMMHAFVVYKVCQEVERQNLYSTGVEIPQSQERPQ